MRPSRAGQRRRGLPRDEEHGPADAVARRAARGLDAPEARALAYGAWDVLDGARTRGEPARGGRRERRGRGHDRAATVRGPGRPGGWRRRRGALGGRRRAEPRLRARGHRAHASPSWTCATRSCTIPTDPRSRRSNLAQAVLLLAYELRLAVLAGADAGRRADAGAARRRGRRRAGDRASCARALARDRLPRPAEPGPHPRGAARALIARRGPTPREVAAAAGPRPAGGAGRAALRADGRGAG